MAAIVEPMDREGFLKMAKYPLIKKCDMAEEMRVEAVEISISAIEKYSGSSNWEACARAIKETMDKKFGAPWNCVAGELWV